MIFPCAALVLAASALLVHAGDVGEGGSCNRDNSKLQIGTYQFFSDCNSKTFCSSGGTCVTKKCRREDFPLGYLPGEDLPPKCPRGEFCPDEGDGCQPWLPVESPCQLNRDDQCEAPENFRELADRTNRGTNFNGSVCLLNKCMWSNVTIGLPCLFENTGYIAYGEQDEFIDIVSRGNCRVGSYCDGSQRICMQNKADGVACGADKECDSYNCGSDGVCGKAADDSNHFAVWVYVVVGLGILVGMVGTLTTMFFVHRKQRDQEREKRVQYWREQNAFRQNIMQMRETAEASINNLNTGSNSQRSTMYNQDSDDSHSGPAIHSHNKGSSGLRNYMSDNDSTDFGDSDGIIMHAEDRRGDANRGRL